MDRAEELFARAMKDPEVATWRKDRVKAFCEYLARNESGERVSLNSVLLARGVRPYAMSYQQLRRVSAAVGVATPGANTAGPRLTKYDSMAEVIRNENRSRGELMAVVKKGTRDFRELVVEMTRLGLIDASLKPTVKGRRYLAAYDAMVGSLA